MSKYYGVSMEDILSGEISMDVEKEEIPQKALPVIAEPLPAPQPFSEPPVDLEADEKAPSLG